jgi:hypothetical protein
MLCEAKPAERTLTVDESIGIAHGIFAYFTFSLIRVGQFQNFILDSLESRKISCNLYLLILKEYLVFKKIVFLQFLHLIFKDFFDSIQIFTNIGQSFAKILIFFDLLLDRGPNILQFVILAVDF